MNGVKLSDFFTTGSVHECVEVIVEVCYVVYSSQLRFGLSHNDMSPWNVLVTRDLSHPFWQFVTSSGVMNSRHHSVHAVIIDFEYSGCEGVISHQQPFVFHPMKDIIEFLITCLGCLLTIEGKDDLIKSLSSFVFRDADRSVPLKRKIANLRSYDRLQRLDLSVYNDQTPLSVVSHLCKRGLYSRRVDARAKVYSRPYPELNDTIRICTGKGAKGVLTKYASVRLGL